MVSSGLRYPCIDFRHRYASKRRRTDIGKGFHENQSGGEYLFEKDDRCNER